MQDRCMKKGTQSWRSRTTQRDEVGRDVGVGVQDGGHTCTPADSCQCVAGATTVL